MKILNLILKNLKEQFRSYWILLLTLPMGPFFIIVYYLITETSKQHFNIVVINNDKGIVVNGKEENHGKKLVVSLLGIKTDSVPIPVNIVEGYNVTAATDKLKNKKADALIIIPESFTIDLMKHTDKPAMVEFYGDLTSSGYLVSAVWANEMIDNFISYILDKPRPFMVKETAIGSSGVISEFNMLVPGILVVSLIMLMFTASIAFVSEVENKTIIRLKLSKLSSFEFVTGILLVQLLIGVISVLVTLFTAWLLGFKYYGSFAGMLVIAVLTSLSIISFSLVIAAATKTVSEVLVVGNFPMFLFMFFTGAAFPLQSEAIFSIAGYDINIQSIMTPTHAISALNKIFLMNMKFTEVIPEMIAIITLTVIYFISGAVLFKRRHLKTY